MPPDIRKRLKEYRPLRLQPDLTPLSDSERKMVPFLLEAAQAMEAPFQIQHFGDLESLLDSIQDADLRRYVQLNGGPWDLLHGNEPILSGFDARPPGANFYPADISRQEFDEAAAAEPALKSQFTMVRRDEGGKLTAIPYHRFFEPYVRVAADRLRQAARLAATKSMRAFLMLRAEALLTDNYRASDLAWMETQDNSLELLIGPMEIEDRLFGIKTAYAASVLIKDRSSSKQLAKYIEWLPRFQASLPAASNLERPGLASDLQVCHVLYFAGLDAYYIPAGVAWPDDEEVQTRKGVRSLLLKDIIQAKFEAILIPLADMFITVDQRQFVSQQAQFDFVMYHELAHGLGIKYTIQDRKPVREALGELQHVVEEAKADLLALVIALRLKQWGEISESELLGLYVTSLVSLLYNYDGRQSVLRLNYFKEAGAYSRDAGTGRYRVHPERMPAAIESLAEKLLGLQGDGNYEGARSLLEQYSQPDQELRNDIARIDAADLLLALFLER